MKFSMFHLFTQLPERSVQETYEYETQIILWADELGFDTAWIAEHHFRNYGTVPNTMLLLASLAAKTKRIRLGNAVVIMPFFHPLRVAEDAAMVDMISGGRLNFGFGRGYQGVEFTAFETSLDDTREKTDEAMAIVLKAWTGEPFSHHGKHWNFDDVQVIPTPVQKPRPPLFYASINPQSIEHNAKRGVPFIVDASTTQEQLRESITAWRRIAREHGHDPDNAEIVTGRLVYLADTDEQAKEFITSQGRGPRSTYIFAQDYHPNREGKTYEEKYARQSAPIDPMTGQITKGYEYWEKGYLGRSPEAMRSSTEEAWEQRWVAGDLDRVIRKIEELEAIGVGNIMCTFGYQDPRFGPVMKPPLPEMRQIMERFAREVIPHFAKKTVTRG